MNNFLNYFINLLKTFQAGTIPEDPAPPADLGDPLTQDEIDFVKKLKKEMDERFIPL